MSDRPPNLLTRRGAALKGVARRELPQIARIVIAAGVAWEICILLGATYPPVFAVIVPLVTLRADPFSSFNLSWSRLVGVVAGLLIGVAVLQFLQPGLLAVALVLAIALVVGMVLRVGNTMNIQVAVSAMLVFSSPDAGAYGLTRLWETAIGAAVTALLSPLLFPPNPLAAARAELARVADTLSRRLRESVRIAGVIDRADTGRVRELVDVLEELTGVEATVRTLGEQIASARRSAPWSVLQRRNMRAAAELGPHQELAARVVVNLESFVEETMTFAVRPEFATDPHLRDQALRELSEPLADAVALAVTGAPFDDALRRARAALAAYRDVEHSRLAAVTRRPLNRIVEDLENFAHPVAVG